MAFSFALASKTTLHEGRAKTEIPCQTGPIVSLHEKLHVLANNLGIFEPNLKEIGKLLASKPKARDCASEEYGDLLKEVSTAAVRPFPLLARSLSNRLFMGSLNSFRASVNGT